MERYKVCAVPFGNGGGPRNLAALLNENTEYSLVRLDFYLDPVQDLWALVILRLSSLA